METQQKKRVLSLIQPTGTFTLGNYLGALKNFVGLQDEYECVYGSFRRRNFPEIY